MARTFTISLSLTPSELEPDYSDWGLFDDILALEEGVPSPSVGDYAQIDNGVLPPIWYRYASSSEANIVGNAWVVYRGYSEYGDGSGVPDTDDTETWYVDGDPATWWVTTDTPVASFQYAFTGAVWEAPNPYINLTWPSRLETDTHPVTDGDMSNTGTETSVRTSGSWKYRHLLLDDAVDLPDAADAEDGAVALVGTGDTSTKTLYVRDESVAWQVAGGNANIFVLDDLRDVPAGASEGDFGFVYGTPLPLRLKTLTLPDAEERLQWVLARDYDLTIAVNAYADGDELEATLAGQGWTTATYGTASITTDGTSITLATAALSSGASLTTLSGSLLSTQRFRILGEVWGGTPSAANFGYLAVGDTSSNDLAVYNINNGNVSSFMPVDSSVHPYYASNRPVFSQLGPSYLSTSYTSAAAVQLCVIDDSAATAGQMLRNGSYYCPVARVSSHVPTFPNGITLAASSGAAGSSYSLYLRNLIIYTVS